MTARFQVRFTRKGTGTQPQERVTAIGGLDPHAILWSLTGDEAVAGVESGEWSFFVRGADGETEIVVASTTRSDKYLKAACDKEQPETLINLPSFPA